MLVIDASQHVNPDRAAFLEARDAGIRTILVAVVCWENIRDTLQNGGRWHRCFINNAIVILQARSADDVLTAKREGKVGTLLDFQNCAPVQDDVKMVQVLHELVVRFMQLSHNNQSL